MNPIDVGNNQQAPAVACSAPGAAAPSWGSPMEAIGSPAQPPPRIRLVSANRQPRCGFADMQVGLELQTGAATHLIDDDGEALPTPQALRNVLADPAARQILAQHKPTILVAMAAEDTTGEGCVELGSFRRIMQSLEIGFTVRQVEDLAKSLLFLAQIGRARGMITSVGPSLVQYSLLFTEAVSLSVPADEGELDGQSVQSPMVSAAPPGSARGVRDHTSSGMAALAAAAHVVDEDDDGEEDDLPLPNIVPFDDAQRKLPFADTDSAADADSAADRTDSEDSEKSSGTKTLSDGRTVSAAARTRAAASQRFRLPSISSSDGREGGLAITLKDGRTFSSAARSRATASQRFRLPSVESLIDAVEKPLSAVSVRASVPELLASANVSVNLSAYSSIGVIAVFFASLSISVVVALLTGSQHLETMPVLLTMTFAAHSIVIVLNVFTVLTMSMVYYYGQLHIGHGFEETASHFVRNPVVKQLRRMALDAFWASAPIFMISMGLTFLSQYTGPDHKPSYGAIVVSSVFGVGMLVTVWAVLSVLRAHREELHYHYHPEDRPKRTEKRSFRALGKGRGRERRESWEDEVDASAEELITAGTRRGHDNSWRHADSSSSCSLKN
jgi:hypothetical protein